jgi:hypothetical protein
MGNTLSLPPARTGKILYFSALEIFFPFFSFSAWLVVLVSGDDVVDDI